LGHLSSRVLEKRLRARCSPVLTGERLRLRQASCECLPMTTTQRSNPRQTPYLWSKWSPAKHSSRGAHCVRRISSAANSWTKSPEKAALEIYGGGLSFISGKCWRTRPMIVSCRSALCRHALQAGAGSAIPDASSAIGTITRYPPGGSPPGRNGTTEPAVPGIDLVHEPSDYGHHQPRHRAASLAAGRLSANGADFFVGDAQVRPSSLLSSPRRELI